MNERGGEVLSHLISLDTRHPASLKQPLSLCQSQGTGEDVTRVDGVHLLHTQRHKYKTNATQSQISQPPGAVINGLLQSRGITGMKTSEGERKKGRRGSKRKVEYVSAESWWSILLPAGYSCKY